MAMTEACHYEPAVGGAMGTLHLGLSSRGSRRCVSCSQGEHLEDTDVREDCVMGVLHAVHLERFQQEFPGHCSSCRARSYSER